MEVYRRYVATTKSAGCVLVNMEAPQTYYGFSVLGGRKKPFSGLHLCRSDDMVALEEYRHVEI